MNSYTPLNHPSFRRSTVAENGHAPAPRPIDRMSRVVTSDSLFRGSHEIGIEHEGSMYRLKITRQGKLILNK
ncbi:hemin uptake protein HemP [Mesorhizobium sp. CAU 1741]|uniref:hemin uptake protein HemP n=1 Tax=Mesorhizobium sp. CAU 1741 TaxID=3140366 RepID=UPI00325B3278